MILLIGEFSITAVGGNKQIAKKPKIWFLPMFSEEEACTGVRALKQALKENPYPLILAQVSLFVYSNYRLQATLNSGATMAIDANPAPLNKISNCFFALSVAICKIFPSQAACLIEASASCLACASRLI